MKQSTFSSMMVNSVKHILQGYTKGIRFIAILIVLLTMGLGQAWAGYNVHWKGNVFFRVPNNWDITTYSTIQIAVSRTTSATESNHIEYLGQMTRVGTTRLYYIWVDNNHSSWNQNEYVFFTANNSTYNSGNFQINANKYYTTPIDYDFINSENPYLYNPTSENNAASVTGSYMSSGSSYDDRRYALLHKEQKINLYTNGSTSNTGGSVKITGVYLTGNTSTASTNVTSSSSSVSYTSAIGSTVTLTATSSTGYQFDGWYTAASGGNAVSTNATYTYTCIGETTLYARFSAKTSTVTLNANGGTGGTAKVTATYGQAMPSATMPTREDYTFNGYFDDASGGTKYYNANGSSAKNWDKTANTNLYAQWSCTAPTNLHIEGKYIYFPGDNIELVIIGDNITNNATYVWRNGDQIIEGQTTATLTINNCDVSHAGNYVCTVTNGTCSAEANFTVKIFHMYGLKDDTWTQPYVFVRDVETNKAILYADLNAETDYAFKLKNGREWYWNEGTMTHDNCTDWLMPQEGDEVYGNTYIRTTVEGTYAFKLDYSDAANLKLSVIYPEKRKIYLKSGVWDMDGAIFVVHAWTDGLDNGKNVIMQKVDDCTDRNIYEAEVEDEHNRVIFVRCNPSGFSIENNIWDYEWNRSSTLWLTNTLPGYQFNIEAWDGGGTWSAFIPYYNISYDMNGHGTPINDACIQDGITWTAPIDPTAAGYTFQGWRRPATSGDSKLYKNGQSGYQPTANETLSAQWQINQCVVTWKVNAAEVAQTVVDIANPLTTIPYTPADDEIGCCAEKFIGWSTETNPTKNQVYTTAAELQNLIGTLAANTTKTFHAVFATPVSGAGTSQVTFSEMGYANEEAVTSVTLGDGLGNGDATITFTKGNAETYIPTYYDIGEAVRVYAGNFITIKAAYANTVLSQIDFTFAKGENANEITRSTGTIKDGVWTGNAQSVTFMIAEKTGHRKIATIAVTTAVTGDEYTNYATKCDLSGTASIGAGTITYAEGHAIEVKCGQRSPASKAATLSFASAQDLTCPVTIDASAGFLVSTNRSDNSKYASNITIKPIKSGTNKGKLPTIYVRYEANQGTTGQISGTISATGSEISNTDVAVLANVSCPQYTLTTVDHLGNTISTTHYYEGEEIAAIADPTTDDCSKDYTFDGWSESSVAYSSLTYNKVTFPYIMPANDVTFYPVYRLNNTEDYHRVTYDLGADNWEGDYLIAAGAQWFANGKTAALSVVDMTSAYSEETISAFQGDDKNVSLISVEGGYVLQTQDEYYLYITNAANASTSTTSNLSTADDYPLQIDFNTKDDIVIKNPVSASGKSIQYYSSENRFGFYKSGTNVYLYKKSPLYTTPLLCSKLEANDAVVTSTAGQTIKVNVPITVTSALSSTINITAQSDNEHFTATPLDNISAGEHIIAVHYTPAADVTTDGIEIANITLTASHGNSTTTFQVTGRHLPENFVIAAKWGDNWYVLPADITSKSITEGLLIEVDNPADPTKALAAPNTTKYGLKSVYTSNSTADRYSSNGERLVFVENISGNNKTLYNNGDDAQNSNNTNIQVYAQYTTATGGYYNTNPDRYEWTPSTTNLKDYTLTSAHAFAGETARTISLDDQGIFGTLLQDKSYNGMVRLLPVDNFYNPAELQVVEWKENSVVIMYNGDPAQTASVSVNGATAQTTTLSDAQRDIAIYELPATGMSAHPAHIMSITIGTEKVILSIPYIVSGTQTDLALLPGSTVSDRQEASKTADLVVLNGATLTADGAKNNPYKFRNVTIYGGGKIVIPSDKEFGVSTLTMRVGAVVDNNYEALYPQLVVNGSINTGNINIDYLTTYDRYYALSLPYPANTMDILYPADIYGANLKTGNQASFALQYYDGAARASEMRKGWTDLIEPATLEPYKGYTFWGAPRKVNVNGESKRQNFGIHRIPIKKTATEIMNGETTDKQIKVYAYPASNAYDAGWNFLGNPYLVQYGNMEEGHTSGLLGALTQNPETGLWEHTGDYRYITITEDGKTYIPILVAEAELYPFNTFFVQAGTDGAVQFYASNRVSLPARRYAAQQETAKEITTGIILTGNDQKDRTGLLIADNFTEEYDFNADLSKFENSGINLYTIGKTGNLAYMAINQALAEQPIPVGYTAPAEGFYTIAFDEDRYNANDISALYLIDYDSSEKTNLLQTDYPFVSGAGTYNQRFALQVAFAPENTTNVEWADNATIQVGTENNALIINNLPNDAAVHVFNALGQVMYHTPTAPTEMQLTLPTGYYLVRIANKQQSVVINTVIP